MEEWAFCDLFYLLGEGRELFLALSFDPFGRSRRCLIYYVK